MIRHHNLPLFYHDLKSMNRIFCYTWVYLTHTGKDGYHGDDLKIPQQIEYKIGNTGLSEYVSPT
jgi:hypothetical protein